MAVAAGLRRALKSCGDAGALRTAYGALVRSLDGSFREGRAGLDVLVLCAEAALK
ncbi:unnamed protein product, partial [Ostreobium quekettii]